MLTSLSNPTLKLIRALQAKRATREKEGLFVVEGVRLAEEAIRAQVRAQWVLHTEKLDPRARAALNQLARLGAQVVLVSPEALQAISDTETPPGLLTVLPFPELPVPQPLTFGLIVDNLRDPGNLGTILRTADAAGAQAVCLTSGTVDAYNPKVVRAAMGAHFHVPLLEMSWEGLTERLAGLEVWLAEAREGERYDQVDWRKPCALLIGSEAEGPSAAARHWATRQVHIPMLGQAESLNAAIAAGVILFEIARQRRGG